MALIKGGTSGTELEINAASKGARVELYKPDGTPLNPDPVGAYIARVEVIPSTVTVNTVYFSIYNQGPYASWIRALELKLGFAGTAAATRSIFGIGRYTGTEMTGGTALTPEKRDSVYPASSIVNVRYAPAGLTTAGATMATAFHLVANNNQLNSDHVQQITFDFPLILAPNEGLYLYAHTALVAGSYCVGSIRWEDYTI